VIKEISKSSRTKLRASAQNFKCSDFFSNLVNFFC